MKDKLRQKVVPIVETTSDQIVTPIYNGKAQSPKSFEQYVEDLSNDQPTNWSRI